MNRLSEIAMHLNPLKIKKEEDDWIHPTARESARALKQEWKGDKKEWKTIENALKMAHQAHEGQWRKSGEAYIIHPIEVAREVNALGLDKEAVSAALLHDVVEDTEMTEDDIEKCCGSSVREMVSALTKIDELKDKINPWEDVKTETIRKMMLSMASDIRVMIIKLCDRKHNLKTIESLKPEKRRRIAKETQDIYAPIASRLGLNGLWTDLMELSFKALHPWRSRILDKALTLDGKEHGLSDEIKWAEKALKKEGITGQITGRRKKSYSVYQKMKEKGLKFKEVKDKEGIRIITDKKTKCYQVLGVVHELWKPIPGYFKDYIAIPKINGYQSLHTTLVNESGGTLEVQIRTQEMHKKAEEGVAAHWAYKAKEHPSRLAEFWLQGLLDIRSENSYEDNYLEHVKTDLFSDEVYVFTPRGKVLIVPRGSCVLDFAFFIHSEVGYKAVSGMINGEKAGLDATLKTGDLVSITTHEMAQVDQKWLAFAKTGRARSHIRSFLKNQKADEAYEKGQSLLKGACEEVGLTMEAWWDKKEAWYQVEKHWKMSKDVVIKEVGRAQLSALAVLKVLVTKPGGEEAGVEHFKPILLKKEHGPIIKWGGCCHPQPGHRIKGVLNDQMGWTVHQADCSCLKKMPEMQLIELIWDGEWCPENVTQGIVMLKVKNERGVLARLTAWIAREDGDIEDIKVKEKDEDQPVILEIKVRVEKEEKWAILEEGLLKDQAVLECRIKKER